MTPTDAPPPHDRAATGSPNGEPSAPKRVLIVEDEALIALDLERRLARLGYDVVGTADNHDDAVRLFAQTRPDIVLMDIFIQGDVDGIQTAADVQGIADVPVVFLTAYADDDTTERASTVSPYGYLLKPFDERSLAVTMRVALQRHASDSRLRILEAAVSSADIGILLVRVDGPERRIEFVNSAFTELSGYPREMVLGQRPCFLAHDPEGHQAQRLQEALEQLSAVSETLRVHRASGELFWSSVSLSPVRDRTGSISHMLVFHADVSREREAQAALAESQRLEIVGRLAAGVAHDFNNVLGSIVLLADLAKEQTEDEHMREDLDEMLGAANRGSLLTRKLLNFCRSDPDESADGAELISTIEESRGLIEQLTGADVDLVLRLPSGPINVALDSVSIEQILLNLAINAADAMPDGGTLTITIERSLPTADDQASQGVATIEVADTGAGIDTELGEQVFEPFFTTKPKGLGTGLGLFMCRTLVENVGGTIGVSSESGKGSRFTITVPLTSNPSDLQSAELPEGVVGTASGATCLLVDDDTAVRRAAARALAKAGFEVVEASTGEAACRALDEGGNELDLVICDIVLPGMSGNDVLAHARRSAPDAHLLAITGFADHSVNDESPRAPTLWKPFNASTLVRRALDLIGRPTYGEENPLEVEAEATPADVAREPEPVPLGSDSGTRVLVIDDDEALARSITQALTGHGLTVLSANSASAGLAALEAQSFDAAIVDINLPDADGVELLTEIKQRDSLLSTLVITGTPTFREAQRALQGRANGFLTKPITHRALIDEVERALGDTQLARLQHRLLMAKSASSALMLDVAQTRRDFAASLEGLFVVFQPLVRPHDSSIFAFEALMRSSGPYANPLDMIAAAEALGRVAEMGRAVRSKIAEALAAHPHRFESIFVNLHPTELRPDLLLREDEPLLPYAGRVVLEVTERVQLSSLEDVLRTTKVLREVGYRIALDDIGDGYAGLSSLVMLGPDVAKIDMSLVRGVDRSSVKRELIGSLVGVCRRNRAQTVAEGVETAEEAMVLADLGVDLLQGYYFSRPAPAFPTLQGAAVTEGTPEAR